MLVHARQHLAMRAVTAVTAACGGGGWRQERRGDRPLRRLSWHYQRLYNRPNRPQAAPGRLHLPMLGACLAPIRPAGRAQSRSGRAGTRLHQSQGSAAPRARRPLAKAPQLAARVGPRPSTPGIAQRCDLQRPPFGGRPPAKPKRPSPFPLRLPRPSPHQQAFSTTHSR